MTELTAMPAETTAMSQTAGINRTFQWCVAQKAPTKTRRNDGTTFCRRAISWYAARLGPCEGCFVSTVSGHRHDSTAPFARSSGPWYPRKELGSIAA